MGKVINLRQIREIVKKLKMAGKTAVLAGGCFDILHFGHLKFLEAAKKQGDVLMVALESDENVKRLKGEGRPINPQKDRAGLLAALEVVDYILLLPEMKTHQDYFNLVKYLRPDIVAVTAGDPHLSLKRKQMREVGGKAKIVLARIKKFSTSKFLRNDKTWGAAAP